MSEGTQVGDKIRVLRESKGLSIEELAERSQSSVKTIEQLESGHLVPSLAPLLKLARGLGVHLGSLLDDRPHPGPVVVRARGDADRVVQFSGLSATGHMSTLEFHSLAWNKEGRHMEPFLIDVHPTVAEECMLSAHEGEEFIYVLAGGIEVTCGEETYQLASGDSIYYESTVPHEVRAAGDADARILAVIYTPV